jgi:hypothetical protein
VQARPRMHRVEAGGQLAPTRPMSSVRGSLGKLWPVSGELREPLDGEGAELRVFVAYLPRFLVLI